MLYGSLYSLRDKKFIFCIPVNSYKRSQLACFTSAGAIYQLEGHVGHSWSLPEALVNWVTENPRKLGHLVQTNQY